MKYASMAAETAYLPPCPQPPGAPIEIFENLSIQLHDDGIDEAALKKLAGEPR